jgi:hypothetical protein
LSSHWRGIEEKKQRWTSVLEFLSKLIIHKVGGIITSAGLVSHVSESKESNRARLPHGTPDSLIIETFYLLFYLLASYAKITPIYFKSKS